MEDRDLQRQTLRLYGELLALSDSWAGKLVFACGETSSATGLPAAVSIAGGTSLVVDPDMPAIKGVYRQGGIDFIVNSLDEALRALKNEIRQKRPLGIALASDPRAVLREMVERGVLPDLHISIGEAKHELESASEEEFLSVLAGMGMNRLRLETQNGVAVPSDLLRKWLAERNWHETLFVRTPTASDQGLLSSPSFQSGPRRRWLERISRYQRIPGNTLRLVWLSSEEQSAIAGRKPPNG